MSAPADRDSTVVRASWRDASWHNRPDTNPNNPKRYHVAIARGIAACDQHGRRLVLDFDFDCPAESVHPRQRCQRPGCVQRWPPYSGSPTEQAEGPTVQT